MYERNPAFYGSEIRLNPDNIPSGHYWVMTDKGKIDTMPEQNEVRNNELEPYLDRMAKKCPIVTMKDGNIERD